MLVGKIQIQDWFGNGIKRAALMNKWVLKGVAIDEDERCLLQTDGSFLYLLCKDGLYKVGSGYSGTVRVCNREARHNHKRSVTSVWSPVCCKHREEVTAAGAISCLITSRMLKSPLVIDEMGQNGSA